MSGGGASCAVQHHRRGTTIDGLVGGRLYGEAQIRTGQNGKRFVTCKVRATTNDGDTIFVNVIAFDDDVQTTLSRWLTRIASR